MNQNFKHLISLHWKKKIESKFQVFDKFTLGEKKLNQVFKYLINLHWKKKSMKMTDSNIFDLNELPTRFMESLSLVEKANAYLKAIYSEFNFTYVNTEKIDEKITENKLIEMLNKHKFITIKVMQILKEKNHEKYANMVICIEKKCLVIESIKIVTIKSILKQIKSFVINSFSNVPEITLNPNDITAQEEINNFYSSFKSQIKNNNFMTYTIEPVISYLIRRHFCPTNYFDDPSFFKFNLCPNAKIIKRNELFNLIDDLLIKEIEKDKNECYQKYEFKSNEFVRLRELYSNNSVIYYLVLHIKTLYIFAMKTVYISISNSKSYQHEKEFCLQNSNRYFVRCFGFVKNKQKIEGFIYEYMSNGSLLNFIKFNNNKISNFFSWTSLIRIFGGIMFINHNNYVHRDLKPGNILIDHDFKCYISDYETIKKIDSNSAEMTFDFGSKGYSSPEQMNGGNVSFQTDIFSFGLIMFYLFEKKDMIRLDSNFECDFIDIIENENIPVMINMPPDLQNLCKKCIKYKPDDRPSLGEIKLILNKIIKSLYFLDQFFLDDSNEEEVQTKKNSKFDIEQYKDEIGEYFYENFLFLNSDDLEEQIKIYSDLLKSIFADDSYSNVLYNLGKMNLNVQKDYLKARKYYKKAVKLKNSNAMTSLGYMYYEGIGCKKSDEKACELFKKSAKQNNKVGQFNYGTICFEGKGVEKNIKKAIKYFERSAKQGYSFAMVSLGYIYRNGLDGNNIDINFAIKYFKESANLNNSFAQNNLGEIYYENKYVPFDYRLAKKYFKLAAKQKNSDAFYNLGNFYYEGKNGKKKYSKALEFFKLAANDNHSNALFKLGKFYYDGEIVEKDYHQAKIYLEKASFLKNADALFLLGEIYLKGLGVEINYIRAIEYFLLSANQNKTLSFFYVANMYEKGLGVEQDLNKAIYYYSKCAEKQETETIFEFTEGYKQKTEFNHYYYLACNILGLIYITENEYINNELAVKYIAEAGLNEYAFGQNSYGLYLKYYTASDSKRIIHFLKKAAENQLGLAEFNIGAIYEREGKYESAHKHYLKSLKHENGKFFFHNQKIKDERLGMSELFINSFTYLKMIQKIIINNELNANRHLVFEYIIKVIFRPVFMLLLRIESESYQFNFMHDHKNSNLIDFFTKFPLFDILDDSIKDQSWISLKTQSLLKAEQVIIYDLESEKEKLERNGFINEKEVMKKRKSDFLYYNIDQEINKTFEEMDKKHKFSYDHICEGNWKVFTIVSKESHNQKSFRYPIDLVQIIYDLIVGNGIDNYISKMEKVLFSPPYKILFGRIPIKSRNKKECISNINSYFYDGFGLQ